MKLFTFLMFDLIDDLKQIECPRFQWKNNEMADETVFSSLSVAVPDSCFPSYVFSLGTVTYNMVRLFC